jgi:EmrB/QacA subfamily drug resistance transporter
VALPTLADSLHASESDLQWFSSGYLLVLAAAMLPAGLLGDRYGRKKVMLASLALFGIASAACALAPSAAVFIAARFALGLAGAGVIVMALSALTVLFDEDERPKAVGVWSAANFLALPLGPILGGWLLSNYWWGWVFLLNLPIALIGLIAVLALVRESPAPEEPGLDGVGIATSVAGLTGVTYGLIEAGLHGWGSTPVLLPIAAGLALLAAFRSWERRLARTPGGQPLVDPSLFRSRSFTWGVILQAVAVVAMVGVLFTMPQYFQAVLGTDAMGAGLRLLPLIAGLVATALPADRLARSIGAKLTVTVGFLLIAAGLALGTTTAVHSSGSIIATWMALVGAGMGLVMATAASAALVELPEERSGVGSAVMQAINKVGAPFGAAVLGSILSAAYVSQLDLTGLSAPDAHEARESVFGGLAVAHQATSSKLLGSVEAAFTHGLDQSLLVSAGVALAGAVLAALFLPSTSALTEPSRTEENPLVAPR